MANLDPEGLKPTESDFSALTNENDDIEKQQQQQQEQPKMDSVEPNHEAPPPPSDSTKNGIAIGNKLGANLPPNWSTAVSRDDGRVYYFHVETGDTTWTHPNYFGSPVPPPPPPSSADAEAGIAQSSTGITMISSMGDASGILNTRSNVTAAEGGGGDFHPMVDKGDYGMSDYNPNEPINSHRCYAIVAFLLFFPLGIFALYQSCNTVSKWKQKKYAKAHDKSQQVLLFSRISCILGIAFWVYLLFFSKPGPFAIDIHWQW